MPSFAVAPLHSRLSSCAPFLFLLFSFFFFGSCAVHAPRDRSMRVREMDNNYEDILSLSASRFRAVTVMHRPCSTLSFTLANFAGVLGTDWPLLVLHDANISAHVQGNKMVRELKRQERLHSSSLAAAGFREVLTNDARAYSKVLVSAHFWAMLRAQHVLVFQLDSILCSLSPWKVHDFLEYDYIGAPWIDRFYGMDVGNGGLSLRKVKTMIHIIKTFPLEGRYENEDIYFAQGVYDLAKQKKFPVRIPPVHVAAKFSYEAGALPRVASFGVHKLPRHKISQKENVAALFKTCPEADLGVWESCSLVAMKKEEVEANGGGSGKAFVASDVDLNVTSFQSDYDINRAPRP